jgi:hypothetical protein
MHYANQELCPGHITTAIHGELSKPTEAYSSGSIQQRCFLDFEQPSPQIRQRKPTVTILGRDDDQIAIQENAPLKKGNKQSSAHDKEVSCSA